MQRTFACLAELLALAGQEVVVTDWHTVTQAHIDAFAEATDDHQWIHVDRERAAAGPFGAPIAHGYLTLSLIAGFSARAIRVEGVRMSINYGLNKVRFMAPVPVDSRLRARFALAGSEPVEGGVQLTWDCLIEREGAPKPVCAAQTLTRAYA